MLACPFTGETRKMMTEDAVDHKVGASSPSPLSLLPLLSLLSLLSPASFCFNLIDQFSHLHVTIMPCAGRPELTVLQTLSVKYISPPSREAMMQTLWLGKLSLRDQGIQVTSGRGPVFVPAVVTIVLFESNSMA